MSRIEDAGNQHHITAETIRENRYKNPQIVEHLKEEKFKWDSWHDG